jgi:hypothetical protein
LGAAVVSRYLFTETSVVAVTSVCALGVKLGLGERWTW